MADKLGRDDIWCVLPAYNNCRTIRQIALECREQGLPVLVVDDGSTDASVSALLEDSDIIVLGHERNRGKGAAIMTALDFLQCRGARFMITIDGDGQHDPKDIPKFIPLIEDNPDSIIIGERDMDGENVPASSLFGRSFSDFWIQFETGIKARDTQSGFRAYPIEHISRLKLKMRRYNFEIEVLARAAWAGLDLKSVPVKAYYPKKEERVSSFRPFVDNARISLTHTRLVIRRLMPWPIKKLVKPPNDLSFLRSPLKFIIFLLKENASPRELGMAAGVGTFIAVLPIFGFHTVAIVYAATRLKLNRFMAVGIQNLCAPPFVPLLCIQLGYFTMHGEWLSELSHKTVVYQLHLRFLEWCLGAIPLAPLLATASGIAVYLLAKLLNGFILKGKRS